MGCYEKKGLLGEITVALWLKSIMGFFKNLEIDVQDLVFSYFDEDGVMIAGENKESILEDVSDLLGVSAVAMAAEEIDLITTRQHVDFLGGSI